MFERSKNWLVKKLGGYTEEQYGRELLGLELRAIELERKATDLERELHRSSGETKIFRAEVMRFPFNWVPRQEELERDMAAKLMEEIRPYIRWSSKDGAYFGQIAYAGEITVVTGDSTGGVMMNE